MRCTARLLTIFFEAMTAKRAKFRTEPVGETGGAALTTKGPQLNREPCSRKREKSAWCRRRCVAGKRIPRKRKPELVGEALAPLRTTVGDDLAAAAGLHTSTETALARAANFGRTIGRLHNCLCLVVKLEKMEERAKNHFSRSEASGKFLCARHRVAS